MRLIKSFSIFLVSVLLATTALGELVKVTRPIHDNGRIFGRSVKGGDLGTDPGIAADKYKEYSSKYCSKPAKKGDKRDVAIADEAQHMTLWARAAPAGFAEVTAGTGKSRKVSDNPPGLWSDQFGTCPGVVVTGKPGKKGGVTRFLYHFSLGSEWSELRSDWEKFAEAVNREKMTNMKGYLFTPDTSSTSPEISGDPFMVDMAADLEKAYTRLRLQLQYLIGTAPTRLNHPFGGTGIMKVDAKNVVMTSYVQPKL